MKNILALIILSSFKLCFATNDYQKIDSLNTILNTSITDSSRCQILNLLSNEYNAINTDTAIIFLKESYSLSVKNQFSNETINSSNTIGNLYSSLGLDAETTKWYLISLEIAEKTKNTKKIAMLNSNLGGVFNELDYKKAITYYQKALSNYIELQNHFWIALTYYQIAFTYEIHEKYTLAIDNYKETVNVFEELKDTLQIAYYQNRVGNVYLTTKEYNKAEEYFNQTLIIYNKKKDTAGIIDSKQSLSRVFIEQGKYREAEGYLLDVKSLFEERAGEYKTTYIWHLISIAEFYIQQKEYSESIALLKEGLIITKDYGGQNENVTFLEIYRLCYKAYESNKEFKNAFHFYKLYSELNDSIVKTQNVYEISSLEGRHVYEKQKAVDDAENEKLVAIEKEAKQKQQIITAATAGSLGLTGVFLFFVFNRLRVTRKQKLIIEHQKEEVEVQKNEAENQRDIANHQKLIVEIKNKEITESITYAKRIQEAILPPPRLVKEWLTESFIFYKPKDIVAGDFYWMETATYKVDNKEKTLVYFAAADCTGHGVPGAMVSVVCANALNRAVKEFGLIEPGHVLDKVTELVIEAFEKSEETIQDGMDIALCALDISAKKVFYSGANNPLYRITSLKEKVALTLRTEVNETHQLIEYKATKQPVGQHDDLKKFETIEIQLEPGDAIYVFSDGFPDQFGGEKGKKYKYSSFRKSLLANFHHPMETQKKLLEKEFNTWKGDLEQIDDVCVIGVKINGVEKKNFTARELEVLSYLQEGLPSKLIADNMNISKHTVDTYRRRLLAKTGTYNSTELINYCIKKEII